LKEKKGSKPSGIQTIENTLGHKGEYGTGGEISRTWSMYEVS